MNDLDALTQGSLLDLRGPQFLAFYVLAMLIAWIGMFFVRRQADPTRGKTPPPLPKDLDARELAWLRGGSEELVRLTGLELVQRGYLKTTAAGDLEENPSPPRRRLLSPAAQVILEIFKRKPSRSELLREGTRAVEDEAATYQARADDERFLMPASVQNSVQTVSIVLMLVLLAIAGAKIAVALSRQQHNIGLLVILMIVTIFIFAKARKVPRLSWRGRAYLGQAQSAMTHLKTSGPRMALEGDPLLLLAAGVYGLDVLDTTPYARYRDYHQPVAASSSSSCSSGSDSSGSSCSSGSSSCSSSSCGGGGGCGGCGGGGGD